MHHRHCKAVAHPAARRMGTVSKLPPPILYRPCSGPPAVGAPRRSSAAGSVIRRGSGMSCGQAAPHGGVWVLPTEQSGGCGRGGLGCPGLAGWGAACGVSGHGSADQLAEDFARRHTAVRAGTLAGDVVARPGRAAPTHAVQWFPQNLQTRPPGWWGRFNQKGPFFLLLVLPAGHVLCRTYFMNPPDVRSSEVEGSPQDLAVRLWVTPCGAAGARAVPKGQDSLLLFFFT